VQSVGSPTLPGNISSTGGLGEQHVIINSSSDFLMLEQVKL